MSARASQQTNLREALGSLLSHLRRYRVGAVYAPPSRRAEIARVLAEVAPESVTLNLLNDITPEALDVLLARDVVARAEGTALAAPALVLNAEALWSPLAPRKLSDAWRALVLSEAPPAPRVLLLHSPAFLDGLAAAFRNTPSPERLLCWPD